MGIVSDVINKFESPIADFVSNSVSELASSVSQPITLGATIYIAIAGLMIAQGRVQVPMSELVWSGVRIGIVFLLATNVSSYNEYIVNIFHKTLPDSISKILISGGGSVSVEQIKDGQIFDTIMERIKDAGGSIKNAAGITDVGTVIFSYIFIAVGVCVIVLISSVVIYAKVGLAIILAVGPLFIGMAIFNATRPFTSSWVSQLANFVILQILVFALFGLLLTLIDTASSSLIAQSGGDQITTAISLTAVLVLSLAFATQLPGIASALSSGGIALGAGLMTGAVGMQQRAAVATGLAAGRAMAAGSRKLAGALRGANTVSKGA